MNFKFLFSLLLIFSTLLAQPALSDDVFQAPNDKIKFGRKSTTTADKVIEFDKGLGSTNPKIKWNNTAGALQFSTDGTTFNAFTASLGDTPTGLFNYSLAASVSSSALTVSLKTAAVSDPSSTDIVYFSFRNSTAATGTFTRRSVTAATSLVISSGSTLGHLSAKDSTIYVYAIDSGSGVVLGASTALFGEGTLQTSVAEGGAGAADNDNTLYSTAAQTSKPVRLIGRMKSNQTTAGTWAAVPTEISLVPFLVDKVQVSAKTANYTLTNTDSVITVDGTSGAFTLTLPTAVDIKGKIFTLSRIDNTLANAITIATTSAQTVDGIASGSYLLSTVEVLRIMSDGANWIILDHKTNTGWVDFPSKTWGGTIASPGSNLISAATTAPTKGTVVTDLAKWKREGNCIRIKWAYRQSSVGTAGSGLYVWNMPPGVVIDTSIVAVNTASTEIATFADSKVGDFSAGIVAYGPVTVYSTTQLKVSLLVVAGASSGANIMASGSQTLATSASTFALDALVPVSGWQP